MGWFFKSRETHDSLGDHSMLGNKSDSNKILDSRVVPEAPVAQQSVVSHPTSNRATATPTAVIGPKIRFKGELVGEEDLLIQGQVEGTIDLKDNNLTVGQQGVIKANVLAKTITIEGEVEGDIFGQERIAILASSNVRGNVVADRVTLEDGAKFRGSIDMDVEARKADFQKITSGSSYSQPITPKKSIPEPA